MINLKGIKYKTDSSVIYHLIQKELFVFLLSKLSELLN